MSKFKEVIFLVAGKGLVLDPGVSPEQGSDLPRRQQGRPNLAQRRQLGSTTAQATASKEAAAVRPGAPSSRDLARDPSSDASSSASHGLLSCSRTPRPPPTATAAARASSCRAWSSVAEASLFGAFVSRVGAGSIFYEKNRCEGLNENYISY